MSIQHDIRNTFTSGMQALSELFAAIFKQRFESRGKIQYASGNETSEASSITAGTTDTAGTQNTTASYSRVLSELGGGGGRQNLPRTSEPTAAEISSPLNPTMRAQNLAIAAPIPTPTSVEPPITRNGSHNDNHHVGEQNENEEGLPESSSIRTPRF